MIFIEIVTFNKNLSSIVVMYRTYNVTMSLTALISTSLAGDPAFTWTFLQCTRIKDESRSYKFKTKLIHVKLPHKAIAQNDQTKTDDFHWIHIFSAIVTWL